LGPDSVGRHLQATLTCIPKRRELVCDLFPHAIDALDSAPNADSFQAERLRRFKPGSYDWSSIQRRCCAPGINNLLLRRVIPPAQNVVIHLLDRLSDLRPQVLTLDSLTFVLAARRRSAGLWMSRSSMTARSSRSPRRKVKPAPSTTSLFSGMSLVSTHTPAAMASSSASDSPSSSDGSTNSAAWPRSSSRSRPETHGRNAPSPIRGGSSS